MLMRDMDSRSSNTTTILDTLLHQPSTLNRTGTATRRKAITVPQQDFQNGEAYSAMTASRTRPNLEGTAGNWLDGTWGG